MTDTKPLNQSFIASSKAKVRSHLQKALLKLQCPLPNPLHSLLPHHLEAGYLPQEWNPLLSVCIVLNLPLCSQALTKYISVSREKMDPIASP